MVRTVEAICFWTVFVNDVQALVLIFYNIVYEPKNEMVGERTAVGCLLNQKRNVMFFDCMIIIS